MTDKEETKNAPDQSEPDIDNSQDKPNQDSSGKPDDPGQQPPSYTCIKDTSLKDTLDAEKWKIQREKIESQCDQKLKECLLGNSDAILKLFKDIADTIEKYLQEYESLNHKFWCIKKTNDSAVSDIPKKDQREIGDIISQVHQKISSLKDCKQQLECLNMSSSGKCEDSNYEPVEKKPDLLLDCKDGNIEALETLKQAADELAKSKKHHDLREKLFNEYKGTLAGIQEKFKKIDDYQQKADKACKDGQKCIQYVYTLMIKRVLDEIQLYSPDELGTKLKDALDLLKAAKTGRCIKEYVKAKIEAMISLLQQNLEEKEKSRDEGILSKIKSTSM